MAVANRNGFTSSGYQYKRAVTAPKSDDNRRRSVVTEPALRGGRSTLFNIMFEAASNAPGWGSAGRDKWLRSFYRDEPLLCGAIQTTAARFASAEYILDGPPKSKAAVQNTLNVSEHGWGWTRLWLPTIIDYFTQDNGAFVEVVRSGPSETDSVVGLNHLDSARCVRTGRWDTPVIYIDDGNNEHLLKWYQVMDFVDMPMPNTESRGMQLCGVSRALGWATIIKEVATYKYEKVSGTFAKQVNVFNGVSHREVKDAIVQHMEETAQAGLTRFVPNVLMSAADHRAALSQIIIELASLPPNWDEETQNSWYCYVVALDLGIDPQDIVPIKSGGKGSSAESEMLHVKGRGKAAALWQTQVEQNFVNQGIVPKNVVFKFKNQDTMIEKDLAQLRLLRAQERAVRIKSMELTPQVARQIAVDEGDLDEDYLSMLAETDITPPGVEDAVPGGVRRGPNGINPAGSQPGAANLGLNRKDVRPLAQSGFPTTNAKVR